MASPSSIRCRGAREASPIFYYFRDAGGAAQGGGGLTSAAAALKTIRASSDQLPLRGKFSWRRLVPALITRRRSPSITVALSNGTGAGKLTLPLCFGSSLREQNSLPSRTALTAMRGKKGRVSTRTATV